MSEYLLAGQQSELERLRLQAEMWEPVGRELLARLGPGTGRRVVDIGCGALGWLRLLAEWVGPSGQVVGTDIDDTLLDAARALVEESGYDNVTLVRDDLFASSLEPASFDLVHSRFVIAPVGRADEQLAVYRKLAAPGALLVLEEPDTGSWHFNPPAPAAERLIDLTRQAFASVGSDLDAGRSVPALLAANGLEPSMHTAVLALPPGHPFLRHAHPVHGVPGAPLRRHRRPRRPAGAPRGGGGRAGRAGPLGHHVHPRPKLGPLLSAPGGSRTRCGPPRGAAARPSDTRGRR